MASGSGAEPPLHRLTTDDRGPIIVIVSFSWIFITSIVAVIRFGLAWKRRLSFKVDDGAFLLGTAFAISSSVCYYIATNGGLGKHMSAVDEAGLDQYYKMIYIGDFMGVAAMASAKTSAVLLSHRVAPREPLSYRATLGSVVAWAVFAIFATAFQCSLPRPWAFDPSSCPSHGNLQYPIIIFNIITDAFLATWILPTLRKLLMDTDKRATVMILFGSRLIVCCFAVVQLSSVARHIRSPDVTYESFGRILWGLCVIHLSVLLATLPRTNRFIAALHSGHTTTLITDFEMGASGAHSKGKGSLSNSEALSGTTAPNEAHTREHSVSPSRRSSRSREPLVDAPLKLTPSVEQNFSTQIISQAQQSYQERKQANTKKYKDNDWRKYLRRSRNEEDVNMNSLFSWTSRTSYGERIVQTREVTQEVEVVPPKESRWVRSKPKRVNRPT